jgi:hypothetical protein
VNALLIQCICYGKDDRETNLQLIRLRDECRDDVNHFDADGNLIQYSSLDRLLAFIISYHYEFPLDSTWEDLIFENDFCTEIPLSKSIYSEYTVEAGDGVAMERMGQVEWELDSDLFRFLKRTAIYNLDILTA